MQFAYRYAAPSSLTEAGPPKLALATAATDGAAYPYFFEGRLVRPRLVADLLVAVHTIVAARFFTPANSVAKAIALADPVVTSGGGLLRFEGFSSCCSAYVRADLLPQSYQGDIVGKGTTNVDFNEPMRAALARVRDDLGLAFSVGQQEFRLRSEAADVIERKVELPTRWIRGMLEVQSYQAGMERRFEMSAVEALRFFRSLPKASTSRTPLWISRGPAGLFTTTRPLDHGVRITDSSRLRVLHALLPLARSLSVYEDDAHQASAWVVDFGEARLTLALSAEVWRGFSGEGQALWALMQADDGEVGATLARVRAQLQWQAALDAPVLARELGTDAKVVEDVLRVLGASGLAGFDVFAGSYFHRVLPFDLSMAEDLHPRLVDARQLIGAGAVKVVRANPFEADVASGDSAHRVRDIDGELRCTCPWFAKHQGERGPCKHVLAAAVLRPESC
ncbi:MAG TPA: SWIM zinc finger family protein [Steroidobacteraceae bacterium]|nr:SWIM zinc finger family protein [Steroidobacteraceae bacterium]